ncbi:MAG: hypothetical protein VX589_11525 [Myxococcota bacterium]|nr:hypothetical protein [Myxococcota bacterium]
MRAVRFFSFAAVSSTVILGCAIPKAPQPPTFPAAVNEASIVVRRVAQGWLIEAPTVNRSDIDTSIPPTSWWLSVKRSGTGGLQFFKQRLGQPLVIPASESPYELRVAFGHSTRHGPWTSVRTISGVMGLKVPAPPLVDPVGKAKLRVSLDTTEQPLPTIVFAVYQDDLPIGTLTAAQRSFVVNAPSKPARFKLVAQLEQSRTVPSASTLWTPPEFGEQP